MVLSLTLRAFFAALAVCALVASCGNSPSAALGTPSGAAAGTSGADAALDFSDGSGNPVDEKTAPDGDAGTSGGNSGAISGAASGSSSGAISGAASGSSTGAVSGVGTTGAVATQGDGGVHAFPGAVGLAQDAKGGRGGTVVHVTNLNDTGPGSFRDAVSAGQRIVVFDVGGYVTLTSAVSVASHITIAGQTAPGDGIGIMAAEVSFSNNSDVIVRYVRFRQGSLDPNTKKSGINLLSANTMIFDHVSIEFASYNNIDAVGAANVTVQNSIDADPIGQQFAAHTEGGPFTWYRNLFANAHNRCPLAKANTQYVGNVVYDYQLGYTAGNSAGVFSHDLIGNYFIAGPVTTTPSDAYFQVNAQVMFSNGNLLDSNADGMLNGTALAVPGAATAATAPWSPTSMLLLSTGAADAYTAVVASAGASLHRDTVDALVIADVKSLGKSGHTWKSQMESGLANSGYGTLSGGTAPTDTDGDGMPDTWELRHGLNPNLADSTGDFDHTGYTNIEKYINGLADGSYP